ncbi:MAG: TerC/Alx family metal homeostasis membrane protein, partial [Chthoniobacterales bacterium]
MRAVLIFAGITLIEKFTWVIYIFALILIYGGIKMLRGSNEQMDPEANPVIKFLRKIMPVSKTYDGDKFFTKQNGLLAATPLFVVLLVIETTDLVFAVDSIPAVIAVTRDPFIVFTSNIFAILGLRALYFALAGSMEKFHLLHYGLAAILIFVGIKMMLAHSYPIKTEYSLGVVTGVLVASIVGSLMFPKRAAHST